VCDERRAGASERRTENDERQKPADSPHQYAKQRTKHEYRLRDGKQHYGHCQPADALRMA